MRIGIAVMLITVALGCAWAAPATAQQPEPDAAPADAPVVSDMDTLTTVYEAALRNDHTLAAARAVYRAGLEARNLARAGLLPRIDVVGGYENAHAENRGSFSAGGTLFPNRTDTTSDTLRFNFSLSQPLFDLSAWFRFQQGKTLSERARAEFAVAQQDLIVRTVEAYFEVLRAVANLRASQAEEIAFGAQLEQVRQRFDVGMVAITDVHEAQAAHDLAVAERIADEAAIGVALERLSVITGQRHSALWRLADEFPVIDPTPAEAEAWVKFALENNYDIKVAAHGRDAAREGAAAAAADHAPKVNLDFNYGESNADFEQENLTSGTVVDFPNNRDDRSVAINVTMPLFTGGATSAARRQADAEFAAAQERYLATVREVTQQTRALFISVINDVARTRARLQAITSSRSAMKAAEAGYEVGTRDIVDVLNAQRAYYSAVRDYTTSRIDYVVDHIALKRQAGTLSPEDIHAMNEWLRPPAAQDEQDEASDRLPPRATPAPTD